ncbi:MAG: S8 family serine peptidase [Acidiferrobacterales bacterium]|nr:S8 family serine peptidase [Acidiferrobacterales bacterium]
MIRFTAAFYICAWIISASANAQIPDLPTDMPVGKITIKFNEGLQIKKTASNALVNHKQSASILSGVKGSVFVSDLLQSDFNTQSRYLNNLSMTLSGLRDELASLNGLVTKMGIEPVKTFSEQSEEYLTKIRLKAEKSTGWQIEDLNLFYDISFEQGVLLKDVIEQVNALDNLQLVESVEVGAPPSERQLPSPNFESLQTYLPKLKASTAMADGIGATKAWDIPGGAGAGVRIMDIELDWNLFHEDNPDFFFISGRFFRGFGSDHGTAVVGILAAKRNSKGVTGIAYDSKIGLMSEQFGNRFSSAQAVVSSINVLRPGDIILIEAQSGGYPQSSQQNACPEPIPAYGPVEFFSAEFAAIRTAVGNGMIVVEAAGNGSINLDHPSLGRKFDRSVRDSGAILVGAAYNPPDDHRPACYTCFGSRIDSHARGASVTTMGYGDLLNTSLNSRYTANFGGTSSASPIVAGAAASIQGMLKAAGRPPLTPFEMRKLLTDTGSPQTLELSRKISTLPDIIKAAKSLGLVNINLAPIYQMLLENE